MRPVLLFFVLLFISLHLFSQGVVTGDLMLNHNVYQRDSAINAYNTPHYDNFLSGTDAWLSLNYHNFGFDAGIRFDLFNNSALHNPSIAYSDQGIGTWFIKRKIAKLTVTGGYFYDQFGNGITFRAYEDRGLGIDNAILGIKMKYELNDNLFVKAFTGRQKDLFDVYAPNLRGLNIEGMVTISDSNSLTITPGASVVNRTLDKQSMDAIVSQINGYPLKNRFFPSYNVFTYSVYNTLSFKNICWSFEYAGKTKDVYFNYRDTLIDDPGSVYYTAFVYSKRGFGVTLQYKRTENFTFRTSPNEILLDGIINYLPSLTRQNTYRLASLYAASTQAIGEQGAQMDVVYSPKKWLTFTFNYAEITLLDENSIISITPEFNPEWIPSTYIYGREPLFREFYMDTEIRKSKKWKSLVGVQYLNYNKDFYENKPGVPVVEAITPLLEFTYKLNRRKSIRSEIQYQFAKQGSSTWHEWIYGLIEFNVAPKYSVGIVDMYSNEVLSDKDIHYYSAYASYTQRTTKFMLSYIKQVEGIVCTGGVCRYEPAFSGFKFSMTTSF